MKLCLIDQQKIESKFRQIVLISIMFNLVIRNHLKLSKTLKFCIKNYSKSATYSLNWKPKLAVVGKIIHFFFMIKEFKILLFRDYKR